MNPWGIGKLVAAAAVAGGCAGVALVVSRSDLPDRQPKARPVITFVTRPGEDASYWTEMKRGASRAARELGASLEWSVAPESLTGKSAIQWQFDALQSVVRDRRAAVVIVPVAVYALGPPVRAAIATKMAVVFVEPTASSSFASAEVGTDPGSVSRLFLRSVATPSRSSGAIICVYRNSNRWQRQVVDEVERTGIGIAEAGVIRVPLPEGGAWVSEAVAKRRIAAALLLEPAWLHTFSASLESMRGPDTQPILLAFGRGLRGSGRSPASWRFLEPDAEEIGYRAVTCAIRLARQETYEPKRSVEPRIR